MMGGITRSNSDTIILHPLHVSLPGCFFTAVTASSMKPSLLKCWAGISTVGRSRFFVLCSLPQITGKTSRREQPAISFHANCAFSPFHQSQSRTSHTGLSTVRGSSVGNHHNNAKAKCQTPTFSSPLMSSGLLVYLISHEASPVKLKDIILLFFFFFLFLQTLAYKKHQVMRSHASKPFYYYTSTYLHRSKTSSNITRACVFEHKFLQFPLPQTNIS